MSTHCEPGSLQGTHRQGNWLVLGASRTADKPGADPSGSHERSFPTRVHSQVSPRVQCHYCYCDHPHRHCWHLLGAGHEAGERWLL